MAARKLRGAAAGWDQSVRERIQTSMLVNRLEDHVLGKCDMTNSQVRAADILLSKTLPTLSQSDVTHSHKHAASDYSTAELVAILERANAANGAGAASPESGGDRNPDRVH